MYNYYCLNNISTTGTKNFNEKYQEVDSADAADAILVRSANMKDMELGSNLRAIARAGAGVNNIPIDKCSEQGIVVFNTPGANANGVKELVIAGMLLASRDIVGGIEWLKSQDPTEDLQKRAEKQKKQYAGHEISGKKLGIIGLGAIGVKIANTAVNLGMKVYGYDPYLSLKAAWSLSSSIKYCQDIKEIYSDCDYITIHVPLNDGTRNMIDEDAFALMKDGAVLLNFSRDSLVSETAVIKALESGKLSKYVTDFVTPAIAQAPNTLITPHLGASTEESEENCAVMAVNQLRDFLENGNIKNSVNYPSCDLGICQSAGRLAVCHRNVPGAIAKFTSTLGDAHVNITNISNKSRGDYAYSLIDTDSPITEDIITKISSFDDVLKVHVVK